MGTGRARQEGRGFPLPSALDGLRDAPQAGADAARWKALFDGPSIGAIAVYAPDGTLKFTNRRMQEMFRVTDEQQAALEGHYNILRDEENVEPAVHAQLVRAFGGEAAEFPVTKYVVRPDDGNPAFATWMRGSVRPVLDAHGKVSEVVLFLVDVSDIESARLEVEEERSRAEAQLREIEHLYDTSPIGLCLLDRELRFVRINDRMAEINGLPKEVHLGRTLREVLPAALVDQIEPLYQGVLDTGEPVLNREIMGATQAFPGAKRHWVINYHPLRGPTGAIEGVGTVVQEVTFLKDTQRALRESEQHLRMVIQHAPVVLWALDAEGNFTLSEGRGLDALALRPGEVVGQSVYDLYADYPIILDRTRRSLQGESIEEIVEVGSRIFHARFIPRRNGKGSVIGSLGVAIDVTEREQAAEERSVLERRVLETQRLESLGVLAGGIAHDFNNLLMGVLGSADLALQEIPPGTAGRQYLKQIETTAVRAAELTNQMLAYSGQGRFVIETICMNRIVREMTGLLQTVISKKATLELDLEDPLPAVEADASQMRQVVMNLITNASEALQDQSGTIRVRTRNRDVTRNQLVACNCPGDIPPGPCISVTVSDDGVGMDAETRRRIFDPFFTTKFTGRGLGLAGVLGIVRGHGGAVCVETTPGGGSVFEILLPLAPGGAPAPKPTKREERVAAGTLRVLVADDDEMVLQVSTLMLESAGFEVVVACDGQEAVELFREQADEIDLVLLDMTMPRLSGEEAFRELREISPDVPVVLSSGYTEQEARGRLEGDGVAGFVQKPYRAVDLMGEIQNALQLSSLPKPRPL
ncbi:MAG: PAS domain-containing protein [Planctomycetota bacterium]|nr:PAS domain-containing protein [Planctomycetota bacterium]